MPALTHLFATPDDQPRRPVPAAPPTTTQPWWSRPVNRPTVAAIVVLLPAALGVLLYFRSLSNGFAYDDIPVIPDNDWVHHGKVLRDALSLPYWPNGALYRPLTSFTYGLDWLLGGGQPLLFHAVNVALYALAVALVAGLVLRLASPVAALVAATLFAVHPTHVEAVANVVGRAELLATLCLLGVALVATNKGPVDTRRLLGVGLLSALALASKETGAVAPLIAWSSTLLRPTPPTDRAPGDVRRTTIASALGVALLLALRYVVLGTFAGDSPHAAFTLATPAQAVALALSTIPRAAKLLFYPSLPRIDYSPTALALLHPDPALVAVGALLLLVGAAAFLLHARRPTPLTWALIFAAATFAPVSNLAIHTGVVLADRNLFAPSVGATLLLGLAAAALVSPPVRPQPLWALFTTVTLGSWAISGYASSASTIPLWHDNTTIFTAMRDRAPTSYRGYYLLAKELRATGPSADAQTDYATAIKLFDHDAGLLYDAGVNAVGLHDTADALAWLGQAVQVSANQRRARTTLALLEIHRSETAAARKLLADGLVLEPDQILWKKLADSLDRSAPPPAPKQ